MAEITQNVIAKNAHRDSIMKSKVSEKIGQFSLTKDSFETNPANYALAFYDIITKDKNAQDAFIASIEEDLDSDEFIGKIIKQLRQLQNKSQEELSEESNVSQAYLSLIENGSRVPKYFILKQIAKSLNVSASLINSLAMLMAQSKDSTFAECLINSLFKEKKKLFM